MWGLNQDSLKAVERSIGGAVELKTECRGQFELVGRRTYCASIIKSGAGEESKGADSALFLKSSWAEERQEHKEPDIIRIAHDRASKLLPKKYCDMVTNHIPAMITLEEGAAESTSGTRLLLKKAGGLEDMCIDCIRRHARVQVVLVTKKLQPVEDLAPVDFWQVFWDIFRCKPDPHSNSV